MKKRYGYIAALICAIISFCGCGKQNAEIEKTANLSNIEIFEQPSADTTIIQESFFPAYYSESTDKVTVDCTLEVPEDFDVYQFHLPKVMGLQYYDTEKAYVEFVEGNEISEKHDQDIITYYVMPDGSFVGIGELLNYYLMESGTYRQVVRSSERGAPQEDFSFETGENCMREVKQALEKIDYPVDEFLFSWFSTSGEDYAVMEQKALEDGRIGGESLKSDGWSEANNAYEIYAWQIYEGLPVFPQIMTTLMNRAIESYQKAPVSALYNKDGLLTLLAYTPYQFEETEEVTALKPFSEIAESVMEKYDNLINDLTYSVTRAKLAVRVYFDEQQQYQAEPVWYFEVFDNDSNLEIAMFNAVSGEEIYLP